MSDPVQRTSTVPIPPFQTELGSQDKLTPGSPKQEDKLDAKASENKNDAQNDSFHEYLTQSTVTTVPQDPKPGLVFDPAKEIASNSAYGAQNGNAPA